MKIIMIIISFIIFLYPAYSDFMGVDEKLDSGTVFPILNESIQLVSEEITCHYTGSEDNHYY